MKIYKVLTNGPKNKTLPSLEIGDRVESKHIIRNEF